MALVVARQKHDGQPRDLADAQGAGRLAPRAFDALFARLLQARQVVDAGAADDAEHCFHGRDAPKKRRPRNGASRVSVRDGALNARPTTLSSW